LTVDIGTERRPIHPLHCSKTIERTTTMFSTAMRAFDRASLSIFLLLAFTPMLAVAAAASIR
jgi:hypothetical protein